MFECAYAHIRTFRLRLRRNAEAFSKTFKVFSEDGSSSADLSHIYSGTLEGEYNSCLRAVDLLLITFTVISSWNFFMLWWNMWIDLNLRFASLLQIINVWPCLCPSSLPLSDLEMLSLLTCFHRWTSFSVLWLCVRGSVWRNHPDT